MPLRPASRLASDKPSHKHKCTSSRPSNQIFPQPRKSTGQVMHQRHFGRSPGQASKLPCIALMGPPGCGKTTVGKILAVSMKLPHVDLDDDILETSWGCTVGQRLAQVGDAEFLEQEAAEVCKLRDTKGVLSLSGSVPLVWKGIEHVSTFALVVYLNVPTRSSRAHTQHYSGPPRGHESGSNRWLWNSWACGCVAAAQRNLRTSL